MWDSMTRLGVRNVLLMLILCSVFFVQWPWCVSDHVALLQVWGISTEDRAVHFRQGVTVSELSGKAWIAVSVPRDAERSHSSASASSLQR